MGQPIVVTAPAAYGCNTADEIVVPTERSMGKLIQLTGNLRVHNNRWRTAYRWREFNLAGEAATLDLWHSLHTQQAIWYLPFTGQGTHYQGKGSPRIIESAGGRMFTLTPNNDTVTILDVSGGKVAPPNMMLAWLCQGENFVVRTDGKNQTQVWDGKAPVFFSTGYNRNAKTASRFPNQAGPTVYAGGRFWTTVFGRRIYASDSLHQISQVEADDLLRFTDQTYDYINVYFAPPASEGDILALTVSINSGFNDSRAQGEVLAMCESPGIWGVQLGIPRTSWPSTNMRHSRSKETGATGQNAFSVRDGDILMRTPKGMESMNLLARERSSLGNPAIDLGADMRKILRCDDERLLIFASLVNPQDLNRLLCTVSPVVVDRKHYHLGFIAANWNPLGERVPSGFAWEGLHTLPYKMGRIVQFLTARIDGQTRTMALLDKGDGASKGLAELTNEEGANLLADGSSIPMKWFMRTKRIAPGGIFKTSGFGTLWVNIDDARTDIELEIFVRSNARLAFKLERKVKITVNPSCDSPFKCDRSGERMVPLGKLFSEHKGLKWGQILIRGQGVCTIDLCISPDDAAALEERVNPDEPVVVDSSCVCDDPADPFYYAMP